MCYKFRLLRVSGDGAGTLRAVFRRRGLHVGPEAANLILTASRLAPDAFVGCAWGSESVRQAGRLTERVLSLHLQKRLKSLEPLKEILRGGW